MALAQRVYGDLVVDGGLAAGTMTIPAASVTNASVAATAGIERTKLAKETMKPFPIPLILARVWDAIQTPLPNPSADDDLGMYTGTFGTAAPIIKTYDASAANAQTLYCRIPVIVPIEYSAGDLFYIRLYAGMVDILADVSCTIDVEAHAVTKDGLVGSDLCQTVAQSINSATFAAKDFSINPSGLEPGDWLDARIAIAINDAASYGNVQAGIASIERVCDIYG